MVGGAKRTALFHVLNDAMNTIFTNRCINNDGILLIDLSGEKEASMNNLRGIQSIHEK